VIRDVRLSAAVVKGWARLPPHIRSKLQLWKRDVELAGLDAVRRRPGFHDEPLKGKRHGQRSIRLSRSYRAIYVIGKDTVEFVRVEEVSKHDY
jgi:proteic killer suppression protein